MAQGSQAVLVQTPDAETPESAAATLRLLTAELAQLRERQAPLLRKRDALVTGLVDGGWSYAQVAEISGLSRGRIGQIVQARFSAAAG